MNIAKINVNGKEYSLLFGFTCYKLFITRCFRYKDTYLTEDGELTGLGLSNLFHSAYLNFCYNSMHETELSYDDMSEWLDEKYKTEDGQKEIVSLIEIWSQSKEIKKLTEEGEKKKKDLSVPTLTN